MFVRCKKRFKDGKEHRYWSVVENVRVSGGRVVQRQVLYLGEINDNQRAAWCRSIEVMEGASRSKQVALFPEDREAPELECEVVRVRLAELTLHAPRQWGACWLALTLWERLELDRFWGPRLPASREGTRWLDILKIQGTFAVVGESGCGKTTTARLILRLEQPSSGRVLMEGEDVHTLRGDALRRFRMRIQAVFQDPWSSLNPRMRVRSIVAESLIVNERLSRKEIDRRVDKVLRDVGMRPEQARNFPHEFSGGQRQRIAIASALISNPALIILDEPVSALDVSIRAQIMNLFKDLQSEYEVSYLLVAHDLGTTRYMADEIAVMYLGQIVEYAACEDLFENPRHPYTRALLRRSCRPIPMNPGRRSCCRARYRRP